MENAPLVRILGTNVPSEIEEKYNNWAMEVYNPYVIKTTPVNQIDRYRITNKNPSYPENLSIWHIANFEKYYAVRDAQFTVDMRKDISVTFNKVEWVWITSYQLMRGFRHWQSSQRQEELTNIQDAPFILLEAYRFNSEEEHKYIEWSIRYANRIYVPLLMKFPGIMGFDRYRNAAGTAFLNFQTREKDYPPYLHMIYFENKEAFDNYEKSPDLASVRRAMATEISNNIKPTWYVQYESIKSWRK